VIVCGKRRKEEEMMQEIRAALMRTISGGTDIASIPEET